MVKISVVIFETRKLKRQKKDCMIFKIDLGPKQALCRLVKVKCCLLMEKLQETDLKYLSLVLCCKPTSV